MILSDKFRLRFDKSELRISLQTAYRQLALDLAKRLYIHFSELVNAGTTMGYKELKRRLSLNLQRQLLRDHNNLKPHPEISAFPDLELEHPDCTHAEICDDEASSVLEQLNSEESLKWRPRLSPQSCCEPGCLKRMSRER